MRKKKKIISKILQKFELKYNFLINSFNEDIESVLNRCRTFKKIVENLLENKTVKYINSIIISEDYSHIFICKF